MSQIVLALNLSRCSCRQCIGEGPSCDPSPPPGLNPFHYPIQIVRVCALQGMAGLDCLPDFCRPGGDAKLQQYHAVRKLILFESIGFCRLRLGEERQRLEK